MKSTMKEAIVAKGTKVSIIDSPIPRPGPGQVVTKVVVSGSNPKDWKRPEHNEPMNQGDDIAGTVHEVGEGVFEFKPGDRVAAFHEMLTPGGSYAEYALSWASTTFLIAEKTSFEEAATLPLAALTAAVGLYARLGLPSPWLAMPQGQQIPLVIYGASGAVGSYAIQFAKRSNIHPLICVAGRAQQHIEALIDRSKGDTIVDYRQGPEAVLQGIHNALDGRSLYHAFDCISEKGSYQTLCGALTKDGDAKIALIIPSKTYPEIPDIIQQSLVTVSSVHGQPDDLRDFGHVFSGYISKGLEEGCFKAQPHEVIPGGLNGIESALLRLKEGRASAVKYVFRIADTEGIDAM